MAYDEAYYALHVRWRLYTHAPFAVIAARGMIIWPLSGDAPIFTGYPYLFSVFALEGDGSVPPPVLTLCNIFRLPFASAVRIFSAVAFVLGKTLHSHMPVSETDREVIRRPL